MENHASKPDATYADPKAAAPGYIDDRELERRVPPIRRATWQKMRSEGRGTRASGDQGWAPVPLLVARSGRVA
jgi:hypothetical protein